MIVKRKHQYEVGDEVYITADWVGGDGICVDLMEEYRGREARIVEVAHRDEDEPWMSQYYIDIDIDMGRWCWNGLCFEPLCHDVDSCDIDLDESAFAELLGGISV